MALEHRSLAVAAVQFHPESLMTLEADVGRRLVANVVAGPRAAFV
jgi:anthranilate synthase